jgi:hypothetical protein
MPKAPKAKPAASANPDLVVDSDEPTAEEKASELATTLVAPVDPELLAAVSDNPEVVAAATEPLGGPSSGSAFVRCNGCGRESDTAATEDKALENALASGWFMSEHEPPLPYCAMHKPAGGAQVSGRLGRMMRGPAGQ